MATAGHEHVYVYYRQCGDAAAAHVAVAALFADIEAQTGVSGRLLVRRDDDQTWMEVYEPVTQSAAFLRLLAERVRQHGLSAYAAGTRRTVERFVAAPPPARTRSSP
jgi:hypothetical protein